VEVQAKDASRKMPVTVPPDRSLARVARLMDDMAVGAVVVVEDNRPIGIVTDRDLVVRALARGLPPESRVDAVMSPGLVTLDATADLREAIRVFSEHPFRRLPLVEEGRVVAMLAVDDLVIDVASDLANLVRPVVGEVIFGHPAPTVPPEAS